MDPKPWMMEKEISRRRSEVLRIAEQEQLARHASPSRGGGILAFIKRLLSKIDRAPREVRRDPKDVRPAEKLQLSR